MDPLSSIQTYFQHFDPITFIVFFVWSFFWKGMALWRSAQLSQKYWFVALLLINTIGILEIVYLFYFAKKRLTVSELKKLFQNKFNL